MDTETQQANKSKQKEDEMNTQTMKTEYRTLDEARQDGWAQCSRATGHELPLLEEEDTQVVIRDVTANGFGYDFALAVWHKGQLTNKGIQIGTTIRLTEEPNKMHSTGAYSMMYRPDEVLRQATELLHWFRAMEQAQELIKQKAQ